MYEQIRVWRNGAFELKLWDTGRVDRRGCPVLAYKLRDGGRLVFRGEDFCGTPMYVSGGNESVAALLSFLALQPGDTDREYFDAYTPQQMEWATSGRAEELSMIAMEMEERAARRRR